MNAYAITLDALADPTRRAVLEALRSGPKPVGKIAERLPVSRPAVSQHLKVLKEAGLVSDEARGTQRVYAIAPAGLEPLRAYLEQLWRTTLDAFAEAARAEAAAQQRPASMHARARSKNKGRGNR